MDLEKEFFLDDQKGNSSASCSICFDLVVDRGERSIAKLQCGHEFHLDCIGSAFNAKGAMQCPNCRKVEKGRWLYASGHRSSTDFDFDTWVTEDVYDLSYSELPFGFQWCPFRGITRLASQIEDGESQPNSYHHESMGTTTYGDHNNASSSTHACPYLALHSYPHALQSAPSSSSSDSVSENNTFPCHPMNFGAGQPSADMIHSHSFTNTEPRNLNWQQQHSIPFSSLGNDQSDSQLGPRLSRSDARSQQRLGSFVHAHPHRGSGARSGSNFAASMGPPLIGETRAQSHHSNSSRRHRSNHIHQQSIPSSSLMSTPFPPIHRPSRPRAFTLISSLSSSSSSSAEIGGFYGFTSVSNSGNRTHHRDAENMTRHFDRFYGWGSREGLRPLPRIPLEGDSQWWGSFNPSQAAPQSGGSFVPRANITSERASQSHRMPRPPPSYM